MGTELPRATVLATPDIKYWGKTYSQPVNSTSSQYVHAANSQHTQNPKAILAFGTAQHQPPWKIPSTLPIKMLR